jgi:hypothetical protein
VRLYKVFVILFPCRQIQLFLRLYKIIFFFITGSWIQGLYLEPLHQHYFVKGFFEIGSCKLFCSGWLQTAILLISASWVAIARITGVSHQCPAYNKLWLKPIISFTSHAHNHSIWLGVNKNTVVLCHLILLSTSIKNSTLLWKYYSISFSEMC